MFIFVLLLVVVFPINSPPVHQLEDYNYSIICVAYRDREWQHQYRSIKDDGGEVILNMELICS